MISFIFLCSVVVIAFFFFVIRQDHVSPVMRKILYEPIPISVWETLETTYGDDEKMFNSAMGAVLRLGKIDNTIDRGFSTPGALYRETKRTGKMSKLCATIMLFDLLRQKGKHCYMIVDKYNPVLYCSTYELGFYDKGYIITTHVAPGKYLKPLLDNDAIMERITGY